MKFATVRELKNRTSAMLRVVAAGSDVLITSHGRPVAVLHGICAEDLEDYILSRDRALRTSIEAADRGYRRRGGISLDEVVRRLRSGKRGGASRR